MQRYSRLVIDANRPPNSPLAIPTVSDNAEIPGNRNLSQAEKDARVVSIFEPMDRAIMEAFSHPRRAKPPSRSIPSPRDLATPIGPGMRAF